jgi:UDP-N-acetylglucosamine 2-epimerase (non-hydrolysing)
MNVVIIVLIGTKAQLVKMAPVIQVLEQRKVPFKFVLTGQHSETMNDLIRSFGIRKPDDILVGRGESDTSMKLLKWLILAFKAVRVREYFRQDPKAIIVHGDTLSTLFGAIIGRLYRIPVAHIEAGLRSFNNFHPFPEEIVRILVSRMAQYHYCPGDWACKNLEGRNGQVINTVKNTLIDSLNFAQMTHVDFSCGSYAVVSLHRHENLSNRKRFDFIMNQIVDTSEKINIKFILHPVTKVRLHSSGWMQRLASKQGIELCERMDYVKFVSILSRSQFLITDGGSNQEEASYMKLPCLLMRQFTERQEGLGHNVVLSNYDPDIIHTFVSSNISSSIQNRLASKEPVSPSASIVDHLESL